MIMCLELGEKFIWIFVWVTFWGNYPFEDREWDGRVKC